MDWFDRKILEHVLLWAPYGGVPADSLLPEFGLTVESFQARVHRILEPNPAVVTSIVDSALIARVRNLRKLERPLLRGTSAPRQRSGPPRPSAGRRSV